jgi:DNA-binding NarL/FixJ family response regulator
MPNQTNAQPVTVVVVDDHPIVRAGVQTYLSTANNFRVVAEAGNGLTGLELCRQFVPDLLILDLNLPGLSGLEVLKQVQQLGLPTRVLILSTDDDSQYICELLKLGAAGYVLKLSLGSQLVEAARTVMQGEKWVAPQLAGRLVSHQLARPSQNCLDRLLSKREIEILTLLAAGLENDEIADRLFLSKNTVQNHVSTIYSKISVHTRSRAILFAIKHGLVKLDEIEVSSI